MGRLIVSGVSVIAEKLLNTQCSKEVELAGVIRFPESFRVKFVTFVCCHDMTGMAGHGQAMHYTCPASSILPSSPSHSWDPDTRGDH